MDRDRRRGDHTGARGAVERVAQLRLGLLVERRAVAFVLVLASVLVLDGAFWRIHFGLGSKGRR